MTRNRIQEILAKAAKVVGTTPGNGDAPPEVEEAVESVVKAIVEDRNTELERATVPVEAEPDTGDEPWRKDKPTYRQMAYLQFSTFTKPSERLAPEVLGDPESPQREHWSFLTKGEASDAIEALKDGRPFKFSNGNVLFPKEQYPEAAA